MPGHCHLSGGGRPTGPDTVHREEQGSFQQRYAAGETEAVVKKGAPESYCLAAIPEPNWREHPIAAWCFAPLPDRTPDPAGRFHPKASRKSLSALVVAIACSTGGRCAAPGMTTSCAPGMA